MDLVLASTDPVAMDIAVCKIIGVEPVGIPVLKRAKVRVLWPERIDYPIRGPKDVAFNGFRLPNTADYLLTGKRPLKKAPLSLVTALRAGIAKTFVRKTQSRSKARWQR
jgi:uncharacterized protein (DUF362 family)